MRFTDLVVLLLAKTTFAHVYFNWQAVLWQSVGTEFITFTVQRDNMPILILYFLFDNCNY